MLVYQCGDIKFDDATDLTIIVKRGWEKDMGGVRPGTCIISIRDIEKKQKELSTLIYTFVAVLIKCVETGNVMDMSLLEWLYENLDRMVMKDGSDTLDQYGGQMHKACHHIVMAIESLVILLVVLSVENTL